MLKWLCKVRLNTTQLKFLPPLQSRGLSFCPFSGLGRWIPPSRCDQHPLLDWGTPARPPAVAGQGAHTDGFSTQSYFLSVITWPHTHTRARASVCVCGPLSQVVVDSVSSTVSSCPVPAALTLQLTERFQLQLRPTIQRKWKTCKSASSSTRTCIQIFMCLFQQLSPLCDLPSGYGNCTPKQEYLGYVGTQVCVVICYECYYCSMYCIYKCWKFDFLYWLLYPHSIKVSFL